MSGYETKFLKLDTIKLAYFACGRGRPLIFLHGNSSNKAFFKSYLEEFGAGYHAFALDSRSHGESVSNDASLTYAMIAADVIGFCRKMGLKDVSVVGYSDGGIVGLHLACMQPDLFTRIIAVSPNYLVSATKKGAFRMLHSMYRCMQFMNKLGLNMKKHLLTFSLMFNETGLTETDLKRIKTKVHIIHAQNDMIYEDHFYRMAKLIPGSTRTRIDACNHLNIMFKNETRSLIHQLLSRK